MKTQSIFPRALLIVSAFVFCLSALLGPGAVAQSPEAPEASEPPAAVLTPLQRKLRSPRDTMKTFLDSVDADDLDAAAECLDLSEVVGTAEVRQAKAREFAFDLKATIDRLLRVDYELISDNPDYPSNYHLSEGQPITGETEISDAALIVISRGKDDLWRFSSETVHRIDDLWERWRNELKISGLEVRKISVPPQIWLRERFPESLWQRNFWLRDYQWICLSILVFVGFAVDSIVRGLMHLLTGTWFRYVHKRERKEAERRTFRPLGLLAQAITWYYGTKLIDLPSSVLTVLLVGLKSFMVFASVWTAFRVVDLIRSLMLRRVILKETKLNELLINLLAQTFKTLAICLGLLLFVQLFDFDVWGLMGGLGIGGIAIALAAKDALSNLFGSITVVMDRPFEIGDWIVTEDIEGTVESVGMRSTRIRTFYNSQIILPNNRLTTAIVDNMGRRRYRRIREVLGVQYDVTPEQMDAFCEGIRELIRQHPNTRKDYFHVYFNGFGDSSLNVLLYCFLECPDWGSELQEKHNLFSDIFRLAADLGVQFAFPTQTVHLFQEQQDDSPSAIQDPMEHGRRIADSIIQRSPRDSAA